MTKTVATEVVDTLKEIGVQYVFGVPSGGWVDYMEAMRKSNGIEFILTTHEGAAGMMADVVGRLTKRPGVCFGTFGPGATNLATGVGEAMLDRSPMIALTDEFAASMRGRTAQMQIDHQAFFRPITKKTTRLRPEAVKSIFFDAATVALSGRPGPVHIGLPVGMSAEIAAVENVHFELPPPPKGADVARIDEAIKAFVTSRKPVIALGLGAVAANVGDAARQLAERFQIPVVLTPMAKGLLPEDHPCYAGVLFHALSDKVGETHREADLVFGIGYDPVEFNYEGWIPNVPVISLDIEPADLDQSVYTLAADVVGNIAESLECFLKLPVFKKDWDLAALASRREAMFEKLEKAESPFGPKAALMVLRDVLPQDGIMTCDVGAHTHLIGQLWKTPAPGLQIMTDGWSTMGFGLPAAIAAKLVKPNTPVCAVVGDGGFLMTVGELATAVRYGVKIVVVVLTDNDLALIRIKQEKKGNPIYGTPVRAKGTIGGKDLFGVPVETATTPEEFREALVRAFAADGPTIVEAIVDSREYDGVVLKKDK
jgi:acetolactate synthase-1/2/3 large subunit